MKTLGNWLLAVFNSFFHWVAFGVIASFIPILVFSDMKSGYLFSGVSETLFQEVIDGNIVLLMIPLVGGLIGETAVRTFYARGLEVFSAITGIALFALIVTYANDFRSFDVSTMTEEKINIIVNNTTTLFCFMGIYALAVMAFSSSKQE